MAIFYTFPKNTNWGNWRDDSGLELLFENQTISALSVKLSNFVSYLTQLSKHSVTCLPFDLSKVNALVGQLCPTLCDPMDCSPPGSSVHGLLQARVLEWGAISFSRASSWPRGGTLVSCTTGRFFTAEPPGKPPFELKRARKPHTQPSELWETPGSHAHPPDTPDFRWKVGMDMYKASFWEFLSSMSKGKRKEVYKIS